MCGCPNIRGSVVLRVGPGGVVPPAWNFEVSHTPGNFLETETSVGAIWCTRN